MANILTTVQMFFFSLGYAYSPAGIHDFSFAFDLSYDIRSNENIVKRTFHAARFATVWTARAAQGKFIEAHEG